MFVVIAAKNKSRTFSTAPHNNKPLAGIRVLEIGQLVAGPFTGTLLGYFGAEVIKIETPQGGDPLRIWRELDTDGTSPWWRSISRNKKSVTVDLRNEEGRAVVRRLAAKSDVLVENFRTGTIEKWGMGPEDMVKLNPDLIFARVSGYGQTGPYAARPGYASVCEAIGGFRYINGFPDRMSVRPNISLGDTMAGLHAAFGVVMALLGKERRRLHTPQEAKCEIVDVAIYESMFNLLESIVPEYDRKGVIRQPSGSTITGIVPTNTYPCKDGKQIVIGGNGDSIFKRLMKTAGRADMANNPEMANNAGRVVHQKAIDDALAEWTKTLTLKECLAALEVADVPSGPIYAVDDMMVDPHFNAREMFEEVISVGKPLKIPAICPRLVNGRGSTEWPGPELGAHTRQVLTEVLEMNDAEMARLMKAGAIGHC